MSIFLVARSLFHDDDDDDSKHVCPAPEYANGPDIVPLFGSMTFHTFSTILSGACGIVSCLVVLFIVFQHATNYTSPVQQRQVIRIVLLVPWVAVFSFLSVWQPSAGEYLVESLDFGCAIALSAFLLLLCDYILSHPDGFDELFGDGAWKRGVFDSSSPAWLKRTWYAVLQFIPTSLIIWLATVISLAVGTYCATSNSIHFAHIWITIFKFIVTTIAILAVFRFYGRMKSRLAPHKVFLKFFAFKGIIGLNVIQTFLINILSGDGHIKPTNHLTYNDIRTVIPALLLACEMPIFAFLLVFAFPVSPYKKSTRKAAKAGAFTAIVQAFNLLDLLSAFVRGPMRLVRQQQKNMEAVMVARADSIPILSTASPPAYDDAMRYDMERGRMAM